MQTLVPLWPRSTRPRKKLTRIRITLPIYLLLMLFHPGHLTLEGKCKDRCYERRQPGMRESFRFTCDDYATAEARSLCLESCEDCPKEVCDETLNANNWHCLEEKFEGDCQKHCNKHRPRGSREGYVLDCNKLDNPTEQQSCKSECGSCPSFICNWEKDAHLFHCPYDNDLSPACKTQCDEIRKFGNVGDFTFACIQQYPRYSDERRQECKNACSKCPHYVCNDQDNFHCPDLQIYGQCQEFCYQNRQRYGNGNARYSFECENELSSKECQGKCDKCAFYSGNNPICDRNVSPIKFHCPAKQPEFETQTGKPSYKGRCMDRCDNNRGGGVGEYTLDCSDAKRYDTDEEREACRNDCAYCPTDVCSSPNHIFHCKIDEKKRKRQEKEREEQEKKHQEHIESRRRQRQESIERRNDYYQTLMSDGNTFLAWSIPLYLVLLACTVTCLWYMSKKNKRSNNDPQQLYYRGGGAVGQQQWSQQQANWIPQQYQQQQLPVTGPGTQIMQQPMSMAVTGQT